MVEDATDPQRGARTLAERTLAERILDEQCLSKEREERARNLQEIGPRPTREKLRERGVEPPPSSVD